MDRTDSDIITWLQKDGRAAFTDIAKALGISEGTVRNRVARLLEDQVIHIVAMVDPAQVGFEAPAMIGVSVDPAQMEIVAETVAAFPEVSYLIMVSGEYDLFVEVLCKDRAHLVSFLNQKLRRVPGVTRTQTYLSLKTYKMAYGAAPMLPHASSDLPGISPPRSAEG